MSTERADLAGPTAGDSGETPPTRRRFYMPEQLARDSAWLQATAHDLKQPLSKLQARFSGVAPDHPDAAYASCVREVAAFIDEMYMLSMSARVREVEASAFDLARLFEVVIDHARPTTIADDIAIEARAEGIWLNVPRVWVFRILTNLVSNAIRHSGCRTVRLTARHDANQITIDVSDDGFGFKPNQRIALNHLEVQRDAAPSAGSIDDVRGYGLKSAMLLATAMGGRLWLVISNRNDGSTWRLELPDLMPNGPVRAVGGAQALKGRTVVVLDDEVHIAREVASRFAALGAEAYPFSDTLTLQTALVHRNLKPDLFVLDFMLSDGTVQRTVRNLASRPGKFRAVILTGKPRYLAVQDLKVPLPVFTKPLRDDDFQQMCEMILNEANDLGRG